MPALLHRSDHVHREPVAGTEPLEGLDIAAAAPAEAVVVADDQLPHAAAADQHLPDETLRRVPGQLPVEPEEHGVVQPGLRQYLPPLDPAGQEQRRRLWIDHRQRVRLEGNQDALPPRDTGPLDDLPQHREMTQVHPVEGADGDDRSLGVLRQQRHQEPVSSTTLG